MLEVEPDIAVVGQAIDGIDALAKAHDLRPDVVLMDVNMPGLNGLEATEKLVTEMPSVAVIIISVQKEKEYMRRAMQVGAREYISKPFTSEELKSSIKRVYQISSRNIQNTNATISEPEKQCHVFLVASGKGGVGKSIIAANVATAIAATGVRTCLVDLNLQFGDVSIYFNPNPLPDSIEQLLPTGDLTNDLDVLETFLGNGPEGLKLLLAPTSPEKGDLVNADKTKAIFDLLKERFDYIVVDSASYFTEPLLESLEVAERVILIVDQTLSGVKDGVLYLKTLAAVSYPADRIMVVLNRFGSNQSYDLNGIKRHLGRDIDAVIPLQEQVLVESINRALPAVVTSPKSDFVRGCNDILAKLGFAVEIEPAKAKERSRFGLRGR